MGMTHTTMESRIFPPPLTNHDTLLSASRYSPKSSTPGLSPISEESSGGYFSDVFDSPLQNYEYTASQTLNTDEFYYSNPPSSDSCYSYTVIPTDTFSDSLSIKTDLLPKTYILPVENYPLPENYTIYEQPLDLYQPSLVDTKSNILYDNTSGELFEDIAMQSKQIYDSPIPSYDVPVYDTTEADDTTETVPTIRLLYADEPNDLLITQLQSADYQSMLTWPDIVRVSGDFTYSHCPSQLAEQVAGAILMEEQVTDNIYHTAKLLVWEKLSKFVQTVPELYQLSKLELNCLWENNKDAMFFFTLGEILNSSLTSLQEQLEWVKLFKLSEFDEGGSFALAPSVTVNLLGRIFNIIFPDYKRYEVQENLKTIANYPNDRIISCFILILIFISMDKPDQNSEKETFFLRLQNIQYKMEMSLKSYLDCQFGSYKELFEQCRQKIEIVRQIAEI
eukprot:GFUD01028777.1.p1 GENE.GFUD01028777.1~~GFUD01028777.1.p1  ORF type:complete len:522 (+),score=110.65 GFUD01028777.1:221-1567(+)